MELINKLLLEAVQGETSAEKQYLGFSEKAVSEGYSGIAALFTGLSYAESIHISNHKKALEKNGYSGMFPSPEQVHIGATIENIRHAIAGEREEFTSMYPSFRKKIMKKHGDNFIAKIALLSIKWAMESEKSHHALLRAAEKSLAEGKDMDSGDYYLCAVCGNLHYCAKFPEELCPVCGHDVSFYSKVDVLV